MFLRAHLIKRQGSIIRLLLWLGTEKASQWDLFVCACLTQFTLTVSGFPAWASIIIITVITIIYTTVVSKLYVKSVYLASTSYGFKYKIQRKPSVLDLCLSGISSRIAYLATYAHRSQLIYGAIKTLSLRQNDVATSFWRNNDVVIASCAHWGCAVLCIGGTL